MIFKYLSYILIALLIIINLLNCADPKSDETSTNSKFDTTPTPSPTPTPRYLYVLSGSCYAGGSNPVLLGSATVSKFDLATGNFSDIIIDYNTASPGDQPTSIVDYDENYFLVLIENTGGRRVDIVSKKDNTYYPYLTNSSALGSSGGIVRDMALLPDYSLLISRSSAIERFSSSKARILVGPGPGAPTLPFVSAPGGSCATSTSLISGIAVLDNGTIVYTHAATNQNRIGSISSTGYTSTSNCLGAETSPEIASSYPTAIKYIASKHLLVTYGGTTVTSNKVYSYDIDENTGLISNGVNAYQNSAVLNGPSAMTEDLQTGDIYIANGINAFNTVEKFTYDSTSRTLTRVGVKPFVNYSIYTRCITGMMVSN